MDGFDDIAVGAPDDGPGAVWILLLTPSGAIGGGHKFAASAVASCPDGYTHGITLPSLCFRNDVAPDSSGISCSQWCRAEATSAGGGCGASGNDNGNCCSGSNCEAGDAYQRFGASLSLVRGKGTRRPTLAVGAPGSGESAGSVPLLELEVIGYTAITFVMTDASGLSTTCPSRVRVEDDEPPTLLGCASRGR